MDDSAPGNPMDCSSRNRRVMDYSTSSLREHPSQEPGSRRPRSSSTSAPFDQVIEHWTRLEQGARSLEPGLAPLGLTPKLEIWPMLWAHYSVDPNLADRYPQWFCFQQERGDAASLSSAKQPMDVPESNVESTGLPNPCAS